MKRLPTPLLLLALLLPLAAGCSDAPTGDTSLDETAAPLSAEAQDALTALPAEAAFLAVADAQALRDGGFFDDHGGPDFTGEAGARLKDFFEATGFDPAQDVRKVYAAKTAGEEDAFQMAVAADYDRARFREQLDGEWGDRFAQETYRGQPLYRSTRSGDEEAFSFALTSGGLILFAPHPDGVRQMIDRLDSGASSIHQDDEAMRLANQVRGRGDVWFVARGLGDGSLQLDPDSTRQGSLHQIERVIRSTAGAVSLSEQAADGELFFYTQESADPADLEEALEGVLSMLSKRDDLSEDKRRALETVEIGRSGEAVRVSFSFDRSVFEE